MSKKIFIFADGTGNNFHTQESNIYRLYNALDKTDPTKQIAYYIKGVGTAGNKYVAALDAITGFGVPSNVQKLYRFLCWNYKDGDEIYLFGFSRGAFTVRTLASLVLNKGLIPTRNLDLKLDLTTSLMQRYSNRVWREYREETQPRCAPLIKAGRGFLKFCTQVYDFTFPPNLYENIKFKHVSKIKFLGVYDTVEAYGLPIEEMRDAISKFVFPLTFSNNVASEKIEHIRHALAIDEERNTFKPIRFETPANENLKTCHDIKEVWFSGAHSDVGGGYEDGDAAEITYYWMVDELNEISNDIEYTSDDEATICDKSLRKTNPYATLHNQRSGMGVFYRYGPRKIEFNSKGRGYNANGIKLDTTLQDPIVHESVHERLMNSNDKHYAPVTLSLNALVRKPEPMLPVSGVSYPFYRQLSLDSAGLNKFLAYLMPIVIGLFLLLPFYSTFLFYWEFGNKITYPVFNYIIKILTGILPNILSDYLQGFLNTSFYTFLFIVALVLLVVADRFLQKVTSELALLTWGKKEAAYSLYKNGTCYLRLAAFLSPFFSGLKSRILRPLGTLIFGVLLFLLFYFSGTKLVSFYHANYGEICEKNMRDISPNAVRQRIMPTKEMCFDTKSNLIAGETYKITLITRNWLDDTTYSSSIRSDVSWPIKFLSRSLLRNSDAELFQPLIQIGSNSTHSTPLYFKEVQKDILYTARYTAEKSGRAYFYLNDAYGIIDKQYFYKNNQGDSLVVIECVK